MRKIPFIFLVFLLFSGCDNFNSKGEDAQIVFIKQTYVTSYSSFEEIQLAKAMSSGILGLSEYRDIQEMIKSKIDVKIKTIDLSITDFYATEKGVFKDSQLCQVKNIKDKNQLYEYILNAYLEDRIIFSVSIYSMEDESQLVGTLLTINPKFNDEGIIKGKMNQGRQVFIPDF